MLQAFILTIAVPTLTLAVSVACYLFSKQYRAGEQRTAVKVTSTTPIKR